jgi:hypothetical protein
MKSLATLSFAVLLMPISLAQDPNLKRGYVPDSATAIQIAEAVLVPVYGIKHIESGRPFMAQLRDGTWTVSGTVRCPDGKGGVASGLECRGGTAVVQIAKVDGRIISMTHGR